jgi:recombination protein RecT
MATVSRQPGLIECTPMSVLRCVVTSTQLGLDCSGILGEAYMVPFKNNKTHETEAQFIIGYRGLVSLARRTGEVKQVEAHTVHQGDTFDIEFGLEPRFVHRPDWGVERSRETMSHTYAIWRMEGGQVHVDVMTKKEVESIRKRSKAKDSGPWAHPDDYLEMAKKTVIRRSSKLVPMTAEMADALHAEDRSEAGLMPALELTGVTEFDHEDERAQDLEAASSEEKKKGASKKKAGPRPASKPAESAEADGLGNPEWEDLWNEAQDLVRSLTEEQRSVALEKAGIARMHAKLSSEELRAVISEAGEFIG